MPAHYTNSSFKVEVKNGFDAQEVPGNKRWDTQAHGCNF